MARHKRFNRKKKKMPETSVMPLCLTAGFFLGFGLGALAQNLLPVTVIGLVAGAAVGYYFDRKHGISYTRRSR